MPKTGLSALCLTVYLWPCSGTGWAACITAPFRFDFGSEKIRTALSMDQSDCSAGFGGGAYVKFDSLTFVRRPANLSIAPNSNGFSFTVKSRGGFRGQDQFTVRICGSNRDRAGCSEITYDVTVR
jgi:hypothetical protein